MDTGRKRRVKRGLSRSSFYRHKRIREEKRRRRKTRALVGSQQPQNMLENHPEEDEVAHHDGAGYLESSESLPLSQEKLRDDPSTDSTEGNVSQIDEPLPVRKVPGNPNCVTFNRAASMEQDSVYVAEHYDPDCVPEGPSLDFGHVVEPIHSSSTPHNFDSESSTYLDFDNAVSERINVNNSPDGPSALHDLPSGTFDKESSPVRRGRLDESDEEMSDAAGAPYLSLTSDISNSVGMVVRIQCSALESIALVLALAVRHNFAYVTVIHTFAVMNAVFGSNYLPTNKKQLWKRLKRDACAIKKHAYCRKCLRLLGKMQDLPDLIVCRCGLQIQKSKARYFITLSVSNQLKEFLRTPLAAEILRYKEIREKKFATNIEDIFDGSAFANLDSRNWDFSYVFNTDGFNIANSSTVSAWPIFIRINEASPHLRQSYVFLAGLWVDSMEPPMNVFLAPFVKEANELSTNGIVWKPNGRTEVTSKFFPLCCCVDAKARCAMLNMAPPTGYNGCTFCDQQGVHINGVKYPLQGTVVSVQRHDDDDEDYVVPIASLRTHEGLVKTMLESLENGVKCGVKGPSVLMNLLNFDLGYGFSTDDLHPIYKGVVEFHTHLCMSQPGRDFYFGSPEDIALIDRRLTAIRTPTRISRKPRSLSLRHQWTGTEWRNWLLYYCIPCLQDVIPARYVGHFGLLSNAVYLLSRDVITEESLVDAERCIDSYTSLFQEYFGPESMRFNVHILLHLVQSVKTFGPLWAHSTFNFESYNHRLMKTVKSPKGVADQVVTRYLMASLLDNIPHNPNICERVKTEIDQILHGKKREQALRVDGGILFGKARSRRLTVEERKVLEDEGFHIEIVSEYKRVVFRNMDCRSVKYAEESRSENSVIYTEDDMFGSVSSIVSFIHSDDLVCGLFVTGFEVGDPVDNASHIVRVLCEDSEKCFISISNVRNLAFTMMSGGRKYVTPMSNQWEID